jgi:hypothetical protein
MHSSRILLSVKFLTTCTLLRQRESVYLLVPSSVWTNSWCESFGAGRRRRRRRRHVG